MKLNEILLKKIQSEVDKATDKNLMLHEDLGRFCSRTLNAQSKDSHLEHMALAWVRLSADSMQHNYHQQNSSTPFEAYWYKHFLQSALCYALLLLEEDVRFELLRLCLSFGSDAEKQILMEGMCLFDEQGDCVELVLEQCRTNNTQLLASIALNNPWPAQHLPTESFHRMVLKSLFYQLDIRLIADFDRHHNATLNRLICDFILERLAAQRPFPNYLFHLIEPDHLTEQQRISLTQYQSLQTD
ncbi:EboA domain-containing protein [Vibrio sp. Isolate22]|uniref:EboA domain-containing protein n=1 Tax=Vibrio TaxID=662 RepID=UPI00165E8F43|nr:MULTISPECIES: EboA domain-containing protein [Vibrio]MCG9693821.1 EboA domain-containing protein [Vibrio sp. Isolate22]MCG9766174.1 EboA domain-containing protein [Vibrio alginolyticus]